MPGPVALVGAGEFLPEMADVDRELLHATGRSRPRVAILPTASWPDGEPVFQRWAAMGLDHFTRLGAEVEPVMVRDRRSADDAGNAQAVGEADLVYLSGGKPKHLLAALEGTRVGLAMLDAHHRGAVLAGCSAGAMVLGDRQWEFRRRMLPWPLRWRRAMAFAPGVTVIPHYDSLPEPFCALMALQAPRGTVVLGIDEGTAVVGRAGAWQVQGAGRVTVWRGRHRERFTTGAVFGVGPEESSARLR